MKYFHSTTITVFTKQDNDKNCLEGLNKFFEIFKLKYVIKTETAKDLDEENMFIHRVKITKQRDIETFFKFIYEKLDREDKDNLIKTISTRVDEACQFFIRFKILPWISDGSLELTDEGDCYHIRTLVAAYPANKNIALKTVKEFFSKID